MIIDDTLREETGKSEGRLHSGVDARRLKREPFASLGSSVQKRNKKEEQCSVD
jgi:hypothetical protein